jgi:malonyl-CoA O-methyltransferase
MQTLPVLEPDAAYALWAANYPAFAHNPLMRAEERAMLSLMPETLEGCRVLDAGCGSGRYLSHARSRGARLLVGVDLSEPMLRRARTDVVCGGESIRGENIKAETKQQRCQTIGLARATLDAIPLRSHWADVTLCGLTIGHVDDLSMSLAELRRVTRPGGLLLCSDVHPIGKKMGWPRDFKANGQRYAVRHAWHELHDWQTTCRLVGLQIERVLEASLDPSDIPPDANFDRQGLQVPVALVLALRRPEDAGGGRHAL